MEDMVADGVAHGVDLLSDHLSIILEVLTFQINSIKPLIGIMNLLDILSQKIVLSNKKLVNNNKDHLGLAHGEAHGEVLGVDTVVMVNLVDIQVLMVDIQDGELVHGEVCNQDNIDDWVASLFGKKDKVLLNYDDDEMTTFLIFILFDVANS